MLITGSGDCNCPERTNSAGLKASRITSWSVDDDVFAVVAVI